MAPETRPASDDPKPSPAEHRPGHGNDPLAGLRERVERAAQELERLRAENASLAARVGELGEEPLLRDAQKLAEPVALLEGDPDALREKIQQFIDALDRVLAERSAPPPAE